MEGHCLLIKRSPGQYMYIIYLTFFLTKDESQSQTISIFDLYLCQATCMQKYMETQIYTNYFFDMKTVVCQIMENSLIRGFPKFEPFCCVFSIICYKMKIGRIIRGGDVYLFYRSFFTLFVTLTTRRQNVMTNNMKR